MEQKEIENHWCIYEGSFMGKRTSCGIGKIIEKHNSSLDIKRSEKEVPQFWSESDIIGEYKTQQEAIKEYIKIFGCSRIKVEKDFNKNFPSYFGISKD